ncbi:MAG TPA: acetyl-CoA carboxylase biotin carboxyl carrier protein [Pirellulaceae bacterium]|nr:acetyl-CoA carboxylase biotin carboxyl carrier protein [Pirellulaceae bacterium]HMO91570.1 acetyl-CoA carboxylase biotin carboxyl carrier protein [Pirellulaceae bacterium]HMP68267.1 acetyl-CoA carboxylase biotin carboxyl carrier protein [Pirellulaceae bacterium]
MTARKEPEKPNDGENVFNVDKIRELIELMKDHELSEIDLQHKPRRIRLRKGGSFPMVGAPMAYPTHFAAPTHLPPHTSGSGHAGATDAAPADDANVTVVKSPMVGTFYLRPKPDQPTYVKVGDHVNADTTVCLIEAMKMFNEIPAGVSGTVVEVLAKDEDAVDVGRPLFKIKTG